MPNVDNLNKTKPNMKAPKPSKTDILSELESIRHSLVDEPESESRENLNSREHPSSKHANSLQKDILDINKDLLTTLSVLDEAQADIKDTTIQNKNDKTDFDEDDIPVLDDLVIDDDTCFETLSKIESKLETSDIKVAVEKENKEILEIHNSKKDDLHHNNPQDESQTELALPDSIDEKPEAEETPSEIEMLEDMFNSNSVSSEENGESNLSNIAQTENLSTEKSTEEKSTAVKVLPGQRSLFDDEIHSDTTKSDLIKQQASVTLKSENLSEKIPSNIEKATKQIFDRDLSFATKKENPFLPPHIRERLAKQKIVMADDAKAHVSALASLKNSASLLSNPSKTDNTLSDFSFNSLESYSKTSEENNYFSESELENHIDKNIDIDTSALVKEILSQKTEVLASALLDAKDGLNLSLAQTNKTSGVSNTSKNHVDDSITDQLLIESLIQQIMPDLEKALREKLEELMTHEDSTQESHSLFDS